LWLGQFQNDDQVARIAQALHDVEENKTAEHVTFNFEDRREEEEDADEEAPLHLRDP